MKWKRTKEPEEQPAEAVTEPAKSSPVREPDPNWRHNPRVWRSRRRRGEQMFSAGLDEWKP